MTKKLLIETIKRDMNKYKEHMNYLDNKSDDLYQRLQGAVIMCRCVLEYLGEGE